MMRKFISLLGYGFLEGDSGNSLDQAIGGQQLRMPGTKVMKLWLRWSVRREVGALTALCVDRSEHAR